MNTNDNIRTNPQDDVIELGVASVETQGGVGAIETFGDDPLNGISDA